MWSQARSCSGDPSPSGSPVRSASTDSVFNTAVTSFTRRPRWKVTAPRWWRCKRPASSARRGFLGSVATPSMTSCWRATPRASVARFSNRCSARRVTLAAAGASDGCPSGYIACLWRAIESSIKKSANSRERAAFSGAVMASQNSAPARATAGHRRRLVLLLLLYHDALGREEQARDGGGVLQCRTGDLRGVDDARRHQILELIGLGVVAEVLVLRLLHLPDDDRAFSARVLGDDADRLLERAAHDLDAGLLIVIVTLGLVERLLTPEQRHAAPRHDALLDRRTSGMQRVLDPSLLLLHLGLGRRADVQHGHAAGKLRQPLLQLFLVIIGRGLLDLGLDLRLAALDLVVLPLAVYERGVVLIHDDTLGAAEIVERRVLELQPELFRNHLATGENSDVAQHLLATVAKARRLDGADFERAAELVDDERRQRLTLDVLGDDQQRLTRLCDFLEHRQEVLHRRDFLLVDEDVGVFDRAFHLFRIGDEVRREVAAVELHAVDRLQRGLEALGFLDRDHAVLADLVHRIGDLVADFGVAVGGNRGDLLDVFPARRGHGDLLQLGDDSLDGALDAALQRHRVRTGCYGLEALTVNRLGQYGRRRGAIAGEVGRLGRHFLHHLRAHVLDLVVELDFLRDSHAVLGDGRATELLVDDDIPALGAERHLHRIGQLIHAALQAGPGLGAELQKLGCHVCASSGRMLTRASR